MKRRPAVTRTIDDVDLVAFLEKNLRPAAASVGRAHPVESLPAAAVHKDNRVRMPHLSGREHLDVHLLAVDERSTRQFDALDADEKIRPLGEVERRQRARAASRLRSRRLFGPAEHPGRNRNARGDGGRGAADEAAPAQFAGDVTSMEIVEHAEAPLNGRT